MAYTLISICILMLRYQPTRDATTDQTATSNKNSLIDCLPEEYRNEMIPEGERYYRQMMLNNNNKNDNRSPADLNPFLQDQKAKKLKNKRNLRKFRSFNSSEDSEDYDLSRNGNMMGQHQRLQRDHSKEDDDEEDDEYLVEETNTYNYGSVPYQYGGSSGKRYGYDELNFVRIINEFIFFPPANT